jgi:hypothetical protein
VHSQGKIDILQYCAVDLADGTSACSANAQAPEPEGKNYDIWFTPNGERAYVSPWNKAEVSVPKTGEIGKSGCKALQYTKGRLRLDGVAAGSHFCVRTIDNRYSEVTLETAVTATSDQITLSYVTWER